MPFHHGPKLLLKCKVLMRRSRVWFLLQLLDLGMLRVLAAALAILFQHQFFFQVPMPRGRVILLPTLFAFEMNFNSTLFLGHSLH